MKSSLGRRSVAARRRGDTSSQKSVEDFARLADHPAQKVDQRVKDVFHGEEEPAAAEAKMAPVRYLYPKKTVVAGPKGLPRAGQEGCSKGMP